MSRVFGLCRSLHHDYALASTGAASLSDQQRGRAKSLHWFKNARTDYGRRGRPS
jgi:hypothetical protein